ncbi:hypothetical protein FB45DRAFT_1055469 [Roridomyces roridus]|uniref:AAA+ ATPase domain-containing protein n=1 Tax=Roridomyces roridus TaxID=1738132 RepID=A0AAD7FS05_9AGAR|nr:hypothetical protein FB45DRAFT_1055469 [Roridomyces roridus]
MGNFDDELAFLATATHDEQGDGLLQHQLVTSPLLTFSALKNRPQDFPSRGLVGTSAGDRVYFNTNAPNSAIVCGVQGSGKSHTLSCLLECGLIPDSRVGQLPDPLSALVFHFDTSDLGRPCEATFLSLPAGHPIDQALLPHVTVLCSPSNVERRRLAYSSLPHVLVQPLQLSEKDLTADRMLAIMGCSNLETAPLYLHTIMRIIRDIGSSTFSYLEFKRRIALEPLDVKQKAMLKLRTDLLDCFIHPGAREIQTYFRAGGLVLIDLTDPFLDGLTASVLFDSVLGSFIDWQTTCGKLVVLDEAHKYLVNSDSDRLTRSLSDVIRLQRHLATRVIIATQEPTVIPATILDLASVIICHRFTSPAWCTHLSKHVSTGNQSDSARWFEEVMFLGTGHALVFCPSALMSTDGERGVTLLGREYLKVRVRPRLTLDGGASHLAVRSGSEGVGAAAAPTFTLTVPSTFVPGTTPRDYVPATPVSPPTVPSMLSPAPSPVIAPQLSLNSGTGSSEVATAAPSLTVSSTIDGLQNSAAQASTAQQMPARFKHLVDLLSGQGAAETPVKLGASVLPIWQMNLKATYPGMSVCQSWNAMLQDATSAKVVELVNASLPLTNMQLRQCAVRLLARDPIVHV